MQRRQFLTLLTGVSAGTLPGRTEAADPSGKPPHSRGPHGHEMVDVPAGVWTTGAAGHYFNPLRKTKTAAFRIATRETTNAQWAEFIRATSHRTDAEKRGFGRVCLEGAPDWAWQDLAGAFWRRPHGPEGPDALTLPQHPVTQISGADAAAYCQWAGGRLPTLTEWEIAARASVSTRYPWGDEWEETRANTWNGKTHVRNTRRDGWVYTAPVGSYPPNAWGLYDVIGNVFEYCDGMPVHVPARQKNRLIAGRGGSWWCSTGTCGFYNLVDIGTQDRHGSLSNQGFRLAMDAARD